MVVLRSGSLVMLGEHPCRITEVKATRSDRGGYVRIVIEGKSSGNAAFDIFTGERFEEADEPCAVRLSPIHELSTMRLMEVRNDGVCQLSNNDGITFKNIRMPEENRLKETILRLFEEGCHPILTIVECMGLEAIVDVHRICS